MKVSVCVTVLNEEKAVGPLLESLIAQSKKADEIVIVDGGSKDKTIEILKHFQKKHREIKLLLEKCTRAQGRNLGVEIARNDIIATTDVGCIAKRSWLENISSPFNYKEVDIVAGLSEMMGVTPLQKAFSVFLGVTPPKFGKNFLPTARSMAFRRSVWERIGGFPEGKGNSAEDTQFSYLAVKLGMKYSRVKDAVVEWGMPETLKEGIQKMGGYAEYDASYGIWWHPAQKLASHNIRIIFIFVRYFLGLLILILGFTNPLYFWLLGFGLTFYIYWAFRKVYIEFSKFSVGVWGIVIQILSDFALMAGFIRGTIGK